MVNDDLRVELVSTSLINCHIEVVVSGSIAAVESVRFVRALRRLGARVTVVLSAGGQQFITPTALEWASGEKVITTFSGTQSHLANGDVCIVAPCSASLIGKIANGISDTPASAKIASYLGSRIPVLLLPAMHDSLLNSPANQRNLRQVSEWVEMLSTRNEEGKQKFPDPVILADEAAHRINRVRNGNKVLITMGSTRGHIDDIRFVSNYSTGATGSAVADDLYRNGYFTYVICGPSNIQPSRSTQFIPVKTHQEMADAIDSVLSQQSIDAGVFAASVLDFEPDQKISGKLSSNSNELIVRMLPTTKLLARAPPKMKAKIAFKLEVDKTESELGQIATQYATNYGLSMVVANLFRNVDAANRTASVFTFDESYAFEKNVNGNRAISESITAHLNQRLATQKPQ